MGRSAGGPAADQAGSCPRCTETMTRISMGWTCAYCGTQVPIHVRLRRIHDEGATLVQVHQVGDQSTFGFEMFAGREADASVMTLSQGAHVTIEAAMIAADTVAHGGKPCRDVCGPWEPVA